MKLSYKILGIVALLAILTACSEELNIHPENKSFTDETDYTVTEDMQLALIGAYAEFQYKWEGMDWKDWSVYLLISILGDDVSKGAKGDQYDLGQTDSIKYVQNYWMYNAVWERLYTKVFSAQTAIEQIQLYMENASEENLGNQYLAEAKVLRSILLLQLTRTWGAILIPESSDPSKLLEAPLVSYEGVLQHISDQMDEAIPMLPEMHPNERIDLRGGVTKYTALAVKALANLELGNYQDVADATGEIISSNEFRLEADFYQLFKLPGKLSNENILEMQYSDFGQGAGDEAVCHFETFGPSSWEPAQASVTQGWGFWEPTMKFVKFMLDRGETVRLETSVLFTDRGIAELKSDPDYTSVPNWVSSTTRDGDVIGDHIKSMFYSGKHYLPSNDVTIGRTKYGSGKNFIVIRYAEILLMHAEALLMGATSNTLSADDAVNIVRERADMEPLSGVTLDQLLDEKFAEFALEWGVRFYDMARHKKYDELSHDGRVFNEEHRFLPYPQNQVDLIKALR